MSYFTKIQFNSHTKHNPNTDIVEGHFKNGGYITYYINVAGNNIGVEGMEYYKGENYGSSGKSYSRHWSADKIPSKYLPMWNELKKVYEKKYKTKTNNENTFSDTYKRLFGELSQHDRAGRNIVTENTVNAPLTEAQSKTWLKVHRAFTNQNQGRNLQMKSGNILLDGHIVESAEKFLNRDVPTMVEVLRNANRKIKGQ